MDKINKELFGQIENKEQDPRYKLNHIGNYIKFK